MPELPEVETIRLGLQKYLVGKTIEGVEVRLRRKFEGDEKNIVGAKIKDVKRFGKGLVIDLDNGYSIAAHIKLTGQFIYRDSATSKLKLSPKVGIEIPNRFTHLIFKLKETRNKRQENAYLYYNDIRQFGWVKIVRSDKLKEISFFKDLGPEFPLEISNKRQETRKLTLDKFKEIIKKSGVAIKPLIMDQKKMSGVGNIYANDGLFDAAIDPRRAAKQLSDVEIERLYKSLLKVLKKGFETGGASELNFVNALGQEGDYQDHLLVYGRKGQKCLRGDGVIKKITLGGRGTYFCPACQR